jgi:hypothetical protein
MSSEPFRVTITEENVTNEQSVITRIKVLNVVLVFSSHGVIQFNKTLLWKDGVLNIDSVRRFRLPQSVARITPYNHPAANAAFLAGRLIEIGGVPVEIFKISAVIPGVVNFKFTETEPGNPLTRRPIIKSSRVAHATALSAAAAISKTTDDSHTRPYIVAFFGASPHLLSTPFSDPTHLSLIETLATQYKENTKAIMIPDVEQTISDLQTKKSRGLTLSPEEKESYQDNQAFKDGFDKGTYIQRFKPGDILVDREFSRDRNDYEPYERRDVDWLVLDSQNPDKDLFTYLRPGTRDTVVDNSTGETRPRSRALYLSEIINFYQNLAAQNGCQKIKMDILDLGCANFEAINETTPTTPREIKALRDGLNYGNYGDPNGPKIGGIKRKRYQTRKRKQTKKRQTKKKRRNNIKI